MDKQQEESRRQFEEYFEDEYGCHPTDYHDPVHMERVWHTWQVIRARVVVVLPKSHSVSDGMLEGEMVMVSDVIESLRSIGLSIKGE